jgi:hypothetical protein
MQTFLSDLEAPDLVHPVVYSPYGACMWFGVGVDMQRLLTVPPVIGHGELMR